ncbi:hypothetical protein GGS20DRAFT_195870 [Poronia punctata]|nr:hypothetical protein GGS20DRAFT_195870 [Poronia punctata]
MSLRVDARASRELYPQLDLGTRTIRLVTLLPGESAEPVHCQLYEKRLTPTLSYKALSYSWHDGDKAPDVPIICNSNPVYVSANLHAALRRLRSPLCPLAIWIDAICINQHDEAERSHQVSLMRDIYQNSREVLIWLGESGPLDDMGCWVMETEMAPLIRGTHENPNIIRWFGDERDIPKLKSYTEEGPKAGAVRTTEDEKRRDIFGAFAILHLLASGIPVDKIWHLRHVGFSNGIVRGLSAIMEKTWWRRMWVVQETIMAREAVVYYGNMCTPWRLFASAAVEYDTSRVKQELDSMLSLLKSGQTLMQFSRIVMEIESTRLSWRKSEPMMPLTLLRKFRSRETSDARDKVFAVLGIIRRWGTEDTGEDMVGITPDYSVDCSQIFFRAAELLIRTTRSLAVLAGTLQGSNRSPPMPSWVTDWHYPPSTNEHIRVGNIMLYNAARYLSGRVALHRQSILETQGGIVDTVDYVGPILENGLGRSRSRLVINEWRKIIAEDSESITGQYVGGGSLHAAFWRTLCADLEFVQHAEKSAYMRQFRRIPEHLTENEAYARWLRIDEQSHRRTSLIAGLWVEPSRSESDVKSKNAFQYLLECAAGGRRFFRTKKGYIGTGPADTNVGDSVAVLLGSQVPFILRHGKKHSERCYGQQVRVLFSKRSSTQAGKGARVQKDEGLHCYSSHQACYSVVGDCYVHGIMEGEIKRTNQWDIGPIYLI